MLVELEEEPVELFELNEKQTRVINRYMDIPVFNYYSEYIGDW